MNDLDEYAIRKKEMGARFKRFRELMEKTHLDLQNEADDPEINIGRISFFEYGGIIPDIVFIQYFTEEYGLNLTWLVKGTGPIFYKKGPKTPDYIYFSQSNNESLKEVDIIDIYKEGIG